MPDPPSPTDVLRDALTRQSRNWRRTVAYYGNVLERPGVSRVPRRLLSDYGFLLAAGFSYVVPARAHIVPHADQRTCRLILLHPYGAQQDLRRLTSRRQAHRVVGSGGVTAYPGRDELLMSAELDASTFAPAKTAEVVERLVNPRHGPAYHFVVNRRGDVIVGAALDDEVSASGSASVTAISIAFETALVAPRAEHAAGTVSHLYEAPLTAAQLTSLATLVRKLQTAYPDVVPTFLEAPTGAGIALVWPTDLAPATPANFTDGRWRRDSPPFDHAETDAEPFFLTVSRQPAFDLATQVFRSRQDPPAPADREELRQVVGHVDTVAEQAVVLGNYAGVAGADRSREMQSTSRHRFFQQRINVAHSDATRSGESAHRAGEAGTAASNEQRAATGYEPHTYDFATGTWTDNNEPY